MTPDRELVTQLLNASGAGDERATAQLFPLIYAELRSLAQARMRGASPGATLQPTALVNEAYIRLFANASTDWNSRAHFFAAAARVMRNIVVDQARRKGALKRGQARKAADIDEIELPMDAPSDDVLALNEALAELERSDPRKAQLVTLYCFAGLTLEEAAAALGISVSTAQREWRFTRALLNRQLGDAGE